MGRSRWSPWPGVRGMDATPCRARVAVPASFPMLCVPSVSYRPRRRITGTESVFPVALVCDDGPACFGRSTGRLRCSASAARPHGRRRDGPAASVGGAPCRPVPLPPRETKGSYVSVGKRAASSARGRRLNIAEQLRKSTDKASYVRFGLRSAFFVSLVLA